MSFTFTIDGLVWVAVYRGITLRTEFSSEAAAAQFLRELNA